MKGAKVRCFLGEDAGWSSGDIQGRLDHVCSCLLAHTQGSKSIKGLEKVIPNWELEQCPFILLWHLKEGGCRVSSNHEELASPALWPCPHCCSTTPVSLKCFSSSDCQCKSQLLNKFCDIAIVPHSSPTQITYSIVAALTSETAPHDCIYSQLRSVSTH